MRNNSAQLKIEQVTHLIDSPIEQKQGKTGAVRRSRYIECNNEQIVMWLDPKAMISKDHFVWFINDAIDSMDLNAE